MIAADRCLWNAVATVLAGGLLLAGCSRYPYGANPSAGSPYGTVPSGAAPYGATPYGWTPPAFGTSRYPGAPATAPTWGTPPGSLAPPTTSVPPPGPAAGSAVPNLPPPPGSNVASGPFPSIERPSWGAPGTVGQQQQRAVVHDPYPDNDVAPEIVGGRPRDFQRPLAPPVRANPLGHLRSSF